MSNRNRMCEVDVSLKHETDQAYLFEHEWSDEPVWISKLSCEFDRETSVVTLRENLANEYGMI